MTRGAAGEENNGDGWQAAIDDSSSHRFAENDFRNDPQVIKEIQRWWFAARRDDSNNDNCLDEGEYSVFYQRIVFAFK